MRHRAGRTRQLLVVATIVAGALSAMTGAEASVVTAATTTAQEGSCHPAYSPCLPIVDDLNCADLSAAQKPVTILQPGIDPYLLDNDWTTALAADGIGCESPVGTTTTTTTTTTAPPTTTTAPPTTTSPTPTAAPTTTVAAPDPGPTRLASTGADVAMFVVLGIVMINVGYLTMSAGPGPRSRRGRR